MKLDPPTCPNGHPWDALVETIPYNLAGIGYDEKDGTFEYSGDTEVNWDGQTTDVDGKGRVRVHCRECCEDGYAESEGLGWGRSRPPSPT